MEIIGLKIKELRKDRKLTQIEFSSKIGIDNSQLSKIEQGKLMPTLSQLLEISSIFKVSLDWLTGKENKKPINQNLNGDDNIMIGGNNSGQVALLQQENSFLKEKITLLEENKILQAKEIKRLEEEIKKIKK
jgi:amino-acid N-acetyltransferase